MSMRVFIAGGSGLIGRDLAKSLLNAGHQPVILSRHADAVRRDRVMWAYQVIPGDPTTAGAMARRGRRMRCGRQPGRPRHFQPNAGMLRSSARFATAVSTARRTWSQRSRTPTLVPRSSSRARPSATTARGATKRSPRSSPSGNDFLAVVCRECEDVSRSIESLGVRRAIVRTGIVLAPAAGALKIMTPIFKLGPGAPIGSGGGLVAKGDQWMSWIHVDDIVGIFRLSIDNDGASGPLNGTAPNPVRNSEFAKTFSSVLKKPYTPWRFYLPVGPPDGMLRLVLGEVATIITTGQKVLPAKPLALGYQFKYPQLAEALRAIFTAAPAPPRPAAHARPAGAGAHH